jgi:hypothetical protein
MNTRDSYNSLGCRLKVWLHSSRAGCETKASAIGKSLIGKSSRDGAKIAGAARTLAALALAAGFLGCSVIEPWSPHNSSSSPAASEKAKNPSQWIGKTLSDVETDLGQPTSTMQLAQTSGYMIIYARPGEPHYVFETGPNGKIVSAHVTQ